MNQEVGALVASEMKRRGTGPRQWARANGFHRRTVTEVFHHQMGSKTGGPVSQQIFDRLIEQEYIDENHNFVESERMSV
ncbi:MAG: hypothetical protein GQ578_09740 [Desulfuromonadaceae bacterium]|nr:hypothetical protein [Desulfuromonadaceae bacterium]